MPYHFTAETLRATAGYPADQPLDPAILLPRLYPVAIVEIARLSVCTLRFWLERHQASLPTSLITCRDRRLRGGILARYGHGLLFVDAEDPEPERRFAIAHETAHFLQDHYYPRLEIIERLGAQIQPVLDGLRSPTLDERVASTLSNASLYLHTHLLDREVISPSLLQIEAEADAFACEILAPQAALLRYLPEKISSEEAIAQLYSVLEAEYRLPTRYAQCYAERVAARLDPAPTLLERLRLV